MRFAAFAGEMDGLLQRVPTVAGQVYRIEFWVYNLGVDNDALFAGFSSNQGGDGIITSPVSTPLEEWSLVGWEFQAAFSDMFVDIRALDAAGAVVIDDVSVTPVPEPGTGALAALLGGVAAWRRRK